MIIGVVMGETLVDEEAEGLDFDLISHIPWKQVINLGTSRPILRSEELCVEMCNLTHLNLANIDLSTWFAGSDGMCEAHPSKVLLRSLDSIWINRPWVRSNDDWSPFMHFPTRRAAAGNRISSLRICGV